MMEQELKRINEFFGRMVDVVLDRPFARNGDTGIYTAEGGITQIWQGKEYSFRVEMPSNFPLYGLRFFYRGNQIARHLLREGLVCLESSFTTSFDQKLELDLIALREWIEVYCSLKEKDHYEYLPIHRLAVFMLFDEPNESIRLDQGAFGTFHYMELPRANGVAEPTFLVLDIGNRSSDWSDHYRLVNEQMAREYWQQMFMTWTLLGQVSNEQAIAFANLAKGIPWPSDVPELRVPNFVIENARNLAKGNKGVYCLLDREPLNQSGEVIKTIGELHQLLNDEIKDVLKRSQDELAAAARMKMMMGGGDESFFFMLGYPLPGKVEIHWELILYPVVPPAGTGKEKRKASQLTWGKTVNASYDRFFGRGKLASSIVDGSILIMGLGALGSSLAQTLVRGGARRVAISDFDEVEAGNICRSTYYFDEIHRSKALSLMEQLILISPYVTVTPLAPFMPQFLDETEDAKLLRLQLNSFSLIIDCTANDAVAWMLDQMELESTVINLSISDEAKHLVAVTNAGKEPILPAKRQIFAALNQTETKATFYEGAGCWHPTFRASYADINMLLQHWIADANHRLTIGKSWTTTVLETIKGDFGLRVVKREDLT